MQVVLGCALAGRRKGAAILGRGRRTSARGSVPGALTAPRCHPREDAGRLGERRRDFGLHVRDCQTLGAFHAYAKPSGGARERRLGAANLLVRRRAATGSGPRVVFSLDSNAPIRASDATRAGALLPRTWYGAVSNAFRATRRGRRTRHGEREPWISGRSGAHGRASRGDRPSARPGVAFTFLIGRQDEIARARSWRRYLLSRARG